MGPSGAVAAFARGFVPLVDLGQVIPIPKSLRKVEDDALTVRKLKNWGATYVLDCEIEEHRDTSIQMIFATPWDTPRQVFCEMAKRYPELDIRVAAYETGQDALWER